MKSIIGTTLLLAAGAVLGNAATVVSGIPTDGLRYHWDFENGTNPVNGAGTPQGSWSNDFGYSSGSGYGTVNASAGHKPWKGNPGLNASSFSISFDLTNLELTSDQTWKTLLSIHTDGGTGDRNSLQVQTSDNGNVTLFPKGPGDVPSFAGAAGSGLNFGQLVGSPKWSTITLTSDGTRLSAYFNGALVGEFSGTSNVAITGIQFGTTFGTDPAARSELTFDIDNVCIWDKALTETEVQLLTGVIPEPSTFGLLAGLGALALVVSRRRRSRRN